MWLLSEMWQTLTYTKINLCTNVCMLKSVCTSFNKWLHLNKNYLPSASLTRCVASRTMRAVSWISGISKASPSFSSSSAFVDIPTLPLLLLQKLYNTVISLCASNHIKLLFQCVYKITQSCYLIVYNIPHKSVISLLY